MYNEENYQDIPELVLKGLIRYASEHSPVGSFLTAVLTNNLFLATGKADEQSLKSLKRIVMFVYNELPGNCWGSPEHVKAWLNKEPLNKQWCEK